MARNQATPTATIAGATTFSGLSRSNVIQRRSHAMPGDDNLHEKVRFAADLYGALAVKGYCSVACPPAPILRGWQASYRAKCGIRPADRPAPPRLPPTASAATVSFFVRSRAVSPSRPG